MPMYPIVSILSTNFHYLPLRIAGLKILERFLVVVPDAVVVMVAGTILTTTT